MVVLTGGGYRFPIIRNPARLLEEGDLGLTMKACVVLHNMIVDDERDSYNFTYDYEHVDGTTPEPNERQNHHSCYAAYLHRLAQVQNPEQYACLQSELNEEIESANSATKIALVLSNYVLCFFLNSRSFVMYIFLEVRCVVCFQDNISCFIF